MSRYKILLLVAITSTLYYLTLDRGIYLEDSGEFVSAAHYLGIAHPSGYPLYLLLAKLFTFIPWGSIAARVNLMSAVFGVATAVMIYLVLVKIAKILRQEGRISDWFAFGLALLFALSRDFWSQSVVAEVYTLNTFFVGLFCYLFLMWLLEPKVHYLLWLAFISGLGITNHQLFALFLPVPWAAVINRQTEKRVSPYDWARIACLFVLGASVYLYLPIRAAADPVINFNHIRTILDSVGHVLRTFYGDISPGIGHKWSFVLGFWQVMALNFTIFPVMAAGLALPVLKAKKQVELSALLLGGFLASFLLPILLRRMGYSEIANFTSRVYYFQAYMFVIFGAFITLTAYQRLRKYFLAALFVLAAVTVWQNYSLVDLHDQPAENYYERKLASMKPSAVYLLVSEGYDHDAEVFILMYLQKVKKLRPDVQIVDSSNIFYRPADPRDKIIYKNIFELRRDYVGFLMEEFRGRPLYASFPVERYTDRFASRPNGYVVEIVDRKEQGTADIDISPASLSTRVEAGKYRHIEISSSYPRLKWDYAFQDFWASYSYQRGLYEGGDFLVQAIKVDNQVDSEDYQAFRAYRASLTSSSR